MSLSFFHLTYSLSGFILVFSLNLKCTLLTQTPRFNPLWVFQYAMTQTGQCGSSRLSLFQSLQGLILTLEQDGSGHPKNLFQSLQGLILTLTTAVCVVI